MRATRWEAHGLGGLDDFRLVEVAVPEPGRGEVTIDIRAAGVNPADLKHTCAVTRIAGPCPSDTKWPGSSPRSARTPRRVRPRGHR